jgi:hypothetical protein
MNDVEDSFRRQPLKGAFVGGRQAALLKRCPDTSSSLERKPGLLRKPGPEENPSLVRKCYPKRKTLILRNLGRKGILALDTNFALRRLLASGG